MLSCVCNGCKCKFSATLRAQWEKDKVHDFLMCLDENVFGTVCSSLLMQEPIPKLEHVYLKVIQGEDTRVQKRLGDERHEGMAFLLGFVEDCVRDCVKESIGDFVRIWYGNQTRSRNLNQDNDVILGKRNVTFMVMEVERILKILFSWSYGSYKYFGNILNRLMEMGECPN